MVSRPSQILESKSGALILHPAHTQLNRLKRKCFGRQSERSDETLLIQNKKQARSVAPNDVSRTFFGISKGALRDFNSCVEKFVEKNLLERLTAREIKRLILFAQR
jgi:hypothetical protein